jgi:hypothetical protein
VALWYWRGEETGMLKPPNAEQLRETSAYYNLELSNTDAQDLLGLIERKECLIARP